MLAGVAGCGGDGDIDGDEVRELFQQRCAACHGEDGGGASGPSLAGVADRLDRDEITRAVRYGRPGMPAWEGTLSDGEIDAVVTYVEDDLHDAAAAGG